MREQLTNLPTVSNRHLTHALLRSRIKNLSCLSYFSMLMDVVQGPVAIVLSTNIAIATENIQDPTRPHSPLM